MNISYMIQNDPVVIACDHLLVRLGDFDEEGRLAYNLTRNDGVVATEADHDFARECIKFFTQPHYGPQQ